MLYEMVRNRQVKHREGEMCQGYEKMGGGQTRKCNVTYVSIEVEIKYKQVESEKLSEKGHWRPKSRQWTNKAISDIGTARDM
jgi:hypothetical protein